MTRTTLTFVSTISTTFACASGHMVPSQQSTPLRVATYNAGLAPLDVPYATERASRVVEALGAASTSLDALCVQEFWVSADYDALASGVRENLPHAIRLPAEPADTTCTPGEIGPLKGCAISKCPNMAGQDLADCAVQNCGSDFDVSASCADCLLQKSSAGGDIVAIERGCLGGAEAGASDAALYGGTYDTALLTRAAPLEQDSLKLDAYLVRSAVHYARLQSDHGDVHVFCAHLASSIPPFEYRGKHGSWEEEQAYQIDQLIGLVNEKAGAGGQVIVLGDLNTGPAVNGLEGELPELYAKFGDGGFTDPYVATGSPECTLCPDNTLRGAGSAPNLDDHVLVRGLRDAPTVERFMTATTSVTPHALTADAGAPDAGTVVTSLSDHYGLVAKF